VRSTPRSRPLLLLVAVALCGPAAAQVQEGDTCEAQSPLDVRVRSNRGQMVLPIDKGEPIEVLSIAGDNARVRSGDMTGTVRLSELEDACRPAAKKCQLSAPVTIEQVPDGTGRRWKIKTGGVLTVTERLPAFSRVTIGPVEGYVPSDELAEICIPVAGKRSSEDDGKAAAKPKDDRPRTPVAFPRVEAGKLVVVAPAVHR
jgi:hypothetical protein